MSEEMNRAPAVPCHECPWRVSNQERPVPEKYAGGFTRTERANLWSALRDGNYRTACHLTIADREKFPHGGDPEWSDMGYQPVPEQAQLRECAGAVLAALREMRRLAEAGSWEEYRRQYPKGLTETAAVLWALRLQGREVPGRPPLRTVSVGDGEIIDPATDADDDFTELDLLPPQQYRQAVKAVEIASRLGLTPGAAT